MTLLNLASVLNAYTVNDVAKRPVPSFDQSLTTDVSTATTGQQKRTREQTNVVTNVMDWEFVFVCIVVFYILVALLSGAPVHLPLVHSVVLRRPTFWREFGSIWNHTNPSFAGSRCSLAWYGGWDVSPVMLARIVRRAQGCLVLSRRIKVSVPSHTLLSMHLAASASCPSSTLNLDIVLNAYTVIDAAKRPAPSSKQSLTTDVSTATTGQQKRTC